MFKFASRNKKRTENDLYRDLLNIKNAIVDTADGVKTRAEHMVTDLLEDVKARASDYHDTVEGLVTDNPFQTLGIAVLFGIFVGKIIL